MIRRRPCDCVAFCSTPGKPELVPVSVVRSYVLYAYKDCGACHGTGLGKLIEEKNGRAVDVLAEYP